MIAFWKGVLRDSLPPKALISHFVSYRHGMEMMDGDTYSDLVDNTSTSSAISHDGDPFGVSSEKANVLLDPVQSETLVVEAGVCNAILLEGWPAKESKGANAVVDCNKNRIVVALSLCSSQET